MAKTKTRWAVNIIESERGWGQRVDETRMFDDYDEALDFVEKYNAENNLPYVPDWYMFAEEPIAVTEKVTA